MNAPPQATFTVALCSMPWAIFNRPSIQLAALTSYLEENSNYKVDAFHPYLDIAALLGTEFYPEIALSGWAGEALFSALLFPEKFEDAKKLFFENISAESRKRIDFTSVVQDIEKICHHWVNDKDLSKYSLIGFSICFSQLLPSLYMAKLIKDRQPKVPVVFGGSSCSGEAGRSLLVHFDQIDYIIDGEGEDRLLTLCNNLSQGTSKEVEGLYNRHSNTEGQHPVSPIDMAALPLPDYSAYFIEIKQAFPASPFIPLLPVEFSRGCWWNKCTFCNLNLQWPTYRYKTGKMMVEEILNLSKKYESLHFTFTDNALPPKEADHFFTQIADTPIDLDFFAEIRGTSNIKRLKNYRKGGLSTIQVGIEALSTSLLDKMKKGNSTMDNIAMMKLCAEQGISLDGNIIVDFPTTSLEEIKETVENLAYVLPFSPLEPATFFLGYGSPIYNDIGAYSIGAIIPHAKTKLLFPKECYTSMTSLINGYRGDKGQQKKRWQPVRKKITEWQSFHKKRVNKQVPALSYRDGANFLIIRQEKPNTATLHHRLRGLSKRIYLHAQIPTKKKTILEQFPQVSAQALETFIQEMCSKRLMFQENNLVLSLAVRQHSCKL